MRRVNCKTCGVKNEKLAFLSDNTKYTLRFAMQIGGLCRAMTITDVSRRMRLDWHTVKDLDKIYMREQLRLAGPPRPERHRRRRNIDPQGPYLPDRRQRSGEEAGDLVRRRWPDARRTWTAFMRF